tara:strand:+ start:33 stop:242 length:210 start_codon:yes stop_codon:yes gene_type:complete
MIKKTENNKDLNKIKNEILNLKKTLLNLNFQKSSGQLEKTHSIRKTKKDIAKLKFQHDHIIQSSGDKNA